MIRSLALLSLKGSTLLRGKLDPHRSSSPSPNVAFSLSNVTVQLGDDSQ